MVGGCTGGIVGSNESKVAQLWPCTGRCQGSRRIIITLYPVTGIPAIHEIGLAAGHGELDLTGITEIKIKIIIGRGKCHQVFRIHGATEEFIRIIVSEGNLYVFDDRTGTHAATGQAIDLRTGLGSDTGKLNTDIPEDAALIQRIRTTVLSSYPAFNGRCGVKRTVGGGFTQQDDTTPVARCPLTGGFATRENNGIIFCTLGYQLGTSFDDQGSLMKK